METFIGLIGNNNHMDKNEGLVDDHEDDILDGLMNLFRFLCFSRKTIVKIQIKNKNATITIQSPHPGCMGNHR